MLHSSIIVFVIVILCTLVLIITPISTATEPTVVVDASTLEGKVLFGYQGWFRTPNDGGSLGAFNNSS